MSKFIDEIIDDIKSNPLEWRDYRGNGIRKDEIIICGFGNSPLLSVIDVNINGKNIPTSYLDLWRLEVTIKNWYRTIPLKTILEA